MRQQWSLKTAGYNEHSTCLYCIIFFLDIQIIANIHSVYCISTVNSFRYPFPNVTGKKPESQIKQPAHGNRRLTQVLMSKNWDLNTAFISW